MQVALCLTLARQGPKLLKSIKRSDLLLRISSSSCTYIHTYISVYISIYVKFTLFKIELYLYLI